MPFLYQQQAVSLKKALHTVSIIASQLFQKRIPDPHFPHPSRPFCTKTPSNRQTSVEILERTLAGLDGVKHRNQGVLCGFWGNLDEKTEIICPVLRWISQVLKSHRICISLVCCFLGE